MIASQIIAPGKSVDRAGAPSVGDASHVAEPSEVCAPAVAYLPRNPRSYQPPIGLIGCGGISHYHLSAYRQAGYNVVALCSRNVARAEQRRQEFFPDAAIYDKADDLLARDDIEVVDVAMHARERVPIVRDALAHRKHVLSQKPFVTDLEVGLRLAEFADRQQVRLAVNQNARWAPHFAYILGAVAAGHIGRTTSVHFSVHWDHDWIGVTRFNDIRHVILFDFGIHWFDLLCSLMPGRAAKRVYASRAVAPGQNAREPLLAQVIVEFDDAQASLVFDGHVQHGAQDRTYVSGEKGALLASGSDLSAQQVVIETAAGLAQPQLNGAWFRNGFHGTMAELLCAIEDNRDPLNSARSSLEGIALALAAVASATKHRPVAPGSVRVLPG